MAWATEVQGSTVLHGALGSILGTEYEGRRSRNSRLYRKFEVSLGLVSKKIPQPHMPTVPHCHFQRSQVSCTEFKVGSQGLQAILCQ